MIILGLAFIFAIVAAAWHKSPNTFQRGGNKNGQERPTTDSPDKDLQAPSANLSTLSPWEKPTGFKIIGLIFFGRPPVVAILDCYLKRNLVTNGGFLDEVLFVENTKNEEDLQYLHELVKNEPLYRSLHLDTLGYDSVWEHAVDDKNLFIKIDDDIVYFSDNAVADIVYTKLKHPETLDVVANLINSPETGWLHYHLGAVHAYTPEMEPPLNQKPAALGPKAWRASELPAWQGDDFEFPINVEKGTGNEVLDESDPAAPPFKGHRWLPLSDQSKKNLYKTPIGHAEYNAFGPEWKSWAIAAQLHYSFLENLEKNQLRKYWYGDGIDPIREGIWDMTYDRMNINFMAIWGKDILDAVPFDDPDDERVLSETLTRKLERPLFVNTHAIAAHFSFRTQHELYDTDLLSRYRAYANEMICTKDNQIKIP